MTIWEFQKTVSKRLLLINLANLFAGRQLLKGSNFWNGVGAQAVGWSLINIGIAVFGTLGTQNRLKNLENPDDAAIQKKEQHNLRRLLLINAGLDVLYMLGGRNLAEKQGAKDETLRGHGWGIVIQGFLLFWFDLIHAIATPRR